MAYSATPQYVKFNKKGPLFGVLGFWGALKEKFKIKDTTQIVCYFHSHIRRGLGEGEGISSIKNTTGYR